MQKKNFKKSRSRDWEMPGYNVIAAHGTKSGLVCPECSLILKEAVQTPDGERLCESCYKAIER